MRGKYSPTVSAAYANDQAWWDKFCRSPEGEWKQFDPEGFDSYGYNKDDVDRAGNHENDYATNDGSYDNDEDYNIAYDDAIRSWGFNGVSPILLSSNDIPGRGLENSWFSDEACRGMTIEFPEDDE